LKPQIPTTALRRGLASAIVLTLAACGGGGGSDSPSATPTPTSPSPATPSSLTLSGVAATGKALAARPVAASCGTGTGTATTLADGSFSITISGGALPCIVRVTDASGTVLHSVANGSGSTAVANITPLTDLVLAQASGGQAAALFANFDATAQGKLNAAALATATTAVASALQGVLSLSGINPFTDALVAATGSATGNALDKKLDALASALTAAQLSVADLAATLVANGPAAAVVVSSQVQPASAHCAAMHSGKYLVINPNEDTAANRLRKVTLDATALTVTAADGTVSSPATPVAGRPCSYTSNNGQSSIVVSSSGVIVNRYLDTNGKARIALIIPEQAVALADLAGTWNTVEFNGNSGTLTNNYAQVTIDATGKLTAVADCQQLAPCTAHTPPAGFTANPAGGFDAVDTDGGVARLFAVRAPSGQLMLAGLIPQGFVVAAKQATAALPAVGAVTPFWDMTVNSSGIASAISEDTSTVQSTDAAAGTFTRSHLSNLNLYTFSVNSPRAGMRSRAANGCTSASGAAIGCNALVSLPVPAFGLTVYGSAVASTNFYGISVTMPAGTVTSAPPASTPAPATAAPGTLAISNGETYALRVALTINAAGQLTGGQYDFHTLSGTLTPCTHSAANDATCFGANAAITVTSQSGALSTAGAATPTTLRVGPDVFGYTFTGTLTGTRWVGTATKVATTASPNSGGGTASFDVDVVITQN
jgi:hypothetical protein